MVGLMDISGLLINLVMYSKESSIYSIHQTISQVVIFLKEAITMVLSVHGEGGLSMIVAGWDPGPTTENTMPIVGNIIIKTI